MTITVEGPDGSTVDFPDGTDQATITGVMQKSFPAKKAEPITANKAVRSLATGVPVLGGLVNQAEAATNATLAPVLNPLFDEKDQLKGSWSERRRASLAQQEEMDRRMAEEHPIADTALKIAGGVGGSLPLMTAAPAAFGLTGTLPQMVARGAASNAALGAADAAVRGEDPVTAAEIGGAVGAAAPVVGNLVGRGVRAVREARNPAPLVPQSTERVAGVDVPLTRGQVTLDPAQQAEEEIMRRGGHGASAEAIAQRADEEARQAIEQARTGIGAQLDPTGASPRTGPQAAGDVVGSELAARQQAEQAAAAARASQVDAQGRTLARDLGGGAAPVTPFDAAESTGAAVARQRDAAVARAREAYQARDAVPGAFDQSVPETMAEDIRARLNTGDNPLWVDPTNESAANRALQLIDQTVGKNTGVLRNAVLPKPAVAAAETSAAAPAAAAAAEDPTIAELRKKFGDIVANAYAKQHGAAAAATAKKTQPLSLLEFIAQKGGLAPDAELEAIGLSHGHRTQIPGQNGFFGTVRKNGADIDRMREAAEEAGYLFGENGATSTPRQFLDAIDAELRGQKSFPRGNEGFVGKREAVARGAAERSAADRVAAGFEQDLQAAGHGELGPQMRDRAVSLMRDEGMDADHAVEVAFRQLEQEDAAAAARAASDFPGDRPMMTPGQERAAQPVDLRAMDEARKRLVTMFGDAKSAALRTGDKSDLRAMGKILHEFDNVIEEALQSGKFSGDAELAARLQREARAAHAEYRQTFSSRGPGDEIGRAVEKIMGRYADSAAAPDEIAAMSYGSRAEPGGGKAAKVALRLRSILGENSADWQRYKQGLFSYLAEPAPGEAARSPAQIADRIERFLGGTKGNSLARVAFSSQERTQLQSYARALRDLERPQGMAAIKDDQLRRAVARISGADGQVPASSGEIVDMLYSRSGKGDKGISVKLGAYLKQNLSPENWTAVRQGLWEKLTNAGEGKTEWGPQMLHQRLHEFLNESGKPLSKIMFTTAERAEMAKLASVYKRMAPLKGTTNPSGTAPMLAKIARKASNNILALIGLGAHGVTGAIAGHAIQRGADAVRDARAGRAAVEAFYGKQARAPIQSSRVPMLLAPAVPASNR